MELPILLAIDTTKNWKESGAALGNSELAIELAQDDSGKAIIGADGKQAKYLLVGDGNTVGPNAARLRAKPEFIAGLPAAIAEAVGAEARARQEADEALQKALADEAQVRQEADKALQEAVGAEAQARQETDEALQKALADEAQVRQEADQTLQEAVGTEAQAREQADEKLQDAINLLVPANLEDLPDLLASKAPIDNPVFTGVVTVPEKTEPAGNDGTAVATEAQIYLEEQARREGYNALDEAVATKAPVDSPVFTGTPKAPTPETSAKDTRIATAEFVKKVLPYTYCVDSDQKLADWANNVKTDGQDYSAVFVAPGTWTLDTALSGPTSRVIDCTLTGTKKIFGTKKSKLVLNNTPDTSGGSYVGIYGYASVDDFSITDLTVEFYQNVSTENSISGYVFSACANLTNCTCIYTGSQKRGSGYGFYNCTNLTNCTSMITCTSISSGYGSTSGFCDCTNLTNCTSTCVCSDMTYVFSNCKWLSNCTGTGRSYVFSNCKWLSNCTGTSTGTCFSNCNYLSNCTGTATGTCFSSCNYLSNCTGTATGFNAYAFNACYYLSNCTGTGNSTGTGMSGTTGGGHGFCGCANLTNCTGTGGGSQDTPHFGYGFDLCTNLTNCAGAGGGAGGGTGGGYGFYSCTRLYACKGRGSNPNGAGYGFSDCRTGFGCINNGASTTATFLNCNMKQEGTVEAWANTAAGGYNLA
jgi:hypothetical protein